MDQFDLIVLPFFDWKKCEAVGFRVRDAHLLREMLNHPSIRRILVVGRPTTLPEMIATRRWWRPRHGLLCYRKGWTTLTQVHEKCFSIDTLVPDVLTPLRLRWRWWSYSLRLETVIRSVQEAQQYLEMMNPTLMVCTPMSWGPVGRLGERLVVFAADDNWLKHTGITGPRNLRDVKAGYDFLLANSDLVVANSDALKRLFDRYRDDIVVLPNGVSLEQFTTENGSVPDDLARIPRPWVGYAGTMTRRVDVDLVAWLARQRPEVHFVFLGPVLQRQHLRPLFAQANVHFLGDKHYSRLPAYLSSFDVTVIPHRVADDEHYGDSLKIYEYLASGKPVVTTNTPDFNPALRSTVSVAVGQHQFLAAVDRYLIMSAQDRAAMAPALRSSIPPDRLWKNLSNQLVELIRAALRNVVYPKNRTHQ